MLFYNGGTNRSGTLASDTCPATERGYGGRAPNSVRLRPLKEIFDGYLSRAPLAYALFRAAECRQLARVPFRRPVLDLGCGNGIFADVASCEPLDIGLDIAFAPLQAAAASVRHRALVQADACRVPLADNSVETVLAVSVCEHWTAPQRSLAEVGRVLRPGGRFIATIVLPGLHDSLLYASLLRGIGLRPLGIRYARLLDRVFAHRSMLSCAEWVAMIEGAGLRVSVSEAAISTRLCRWFDFWLATALPQKLMGCAPRRIGRWPRWTRRVFWKLFERAELRQNDGSVLFVVACKPLEIRRDQ